MMLPVASVSRGIIVRAVELAVVMAPRSHNESPETYTNFPIEKAEPFATDTVLGTPIVKSIGAGVVTAVATLDKPARKSTRFAVDDARITATPSDAVKSNSEP